MNNAERAQALYADAVCKFNAGDVDAAALIISELPKISVKFEEDASYLLLRGLIQENFGQPFLATESLIKAHKSDLRRIEIVDHIWRIFLKIGDAERASQYMMKSISMKKYIGKEDVFVFGDSHSDFMFYGIPRCKSQSLGPRTMHRIGRDGLDVLNFRKLGVPDDSHVVLVFGEIDVRTHVLRQRDEKGRELHDIISSLCESYISTAISNREMYGNVNVIICSVVPPTNGLEDRDLPYFGDITERAKVTNMVNDFLLGHCEKSGISFLNFHKYFQDKMGFLLRPLSDGLVHVRREFCGIVEYELEMELSKLAARRA